MLNVFDVERGSFHDGPGIRTVVFLKGCPMRCAWCQNPESQSAKPQILQYKKKCIGCGNCIRRCPGRCISVKDQEVFIDREHCTGCGDCADGCHAEALNLSGRSFTTDEVLAKIREDASFFAISGGGVTVSGGEPLMQYQEVAELLKKCREEGYTTAIETCGCAEYEAFEAVLPYLDYLFYDVKILDTAVHKKYCGVGNERILDNLRRLGGARIDLTVRTPIIPGVNDSEQFIRELGDFLRQVERIRSVELLPFHSMCTNKYEALGQSWQYAHKKSPDGSWMKTLKSILASYGLPVKGVTELI